MPVGFPATDSGSDIRLLKYFFDYDDIPVLLVLNYQYKSLKNIKESVKCKNFSSNQVKEILEKLISKGLIRWKNKKDGRYYKILPLIVGLDESQNYNRTPEYLNLLRKYMIESKFALRLITSKIPQLRTIPIEKSIEPQHHISIYDDMRKIIENIEEPIVLLDCICKKTARIDGKECKQTSRLDTCLVFNEVALRWLKRGFGKKINKQEALKVLKKNQRDGLVLQPSNSKNPEFLCSCCGCCCGILSLQKMVPNPAEYWTSTYQAQVGPDLCEGCRTCLERCQVSAIIFKKEIAHINLKRCIGCGNCVITCPNQAISLIKRENIPSIPNDSEELYESILKLP